MTNPISNFYPVLAYISSVTQGQQTIVTFTENHTFTVGEIISFRVSQPYGMVQLNNHQALVLAITPTTVTVPIDSMNYTPFNGSPSEPITYLAMAVPAGSGVVPGAYPAQTNLQDAFDNVPVT